MKPFITPLACLFLAPLSAQTIQHGNLGPFGVTTDMHRLVAGPGLPTLGEGAGQTWDLSDLELLNVGTMTFAQADGTPHAAEFPEANWVWTHHVTGVGSAYYFIEIGSEGMDLWDRNVGLPNPVIYTDPVRIMKFPLELGESFTDTYSTGGDVNYKHWTYAGHGTLILPVATLANVALVVSEEGDLAFWNTSPLYPVMIADPGSAMFYVQNNVGIGEQAMPALAVWPNPCTDVLHLPDATGAAHWSVVDMQGRRLLEGLASGPATRKVNVGLLAPGGYMLLLETEGTRQQVRFVKK
ncbi:MAG TPA: T9SS type A sorting domain-containing protein [Flavobacteriales bacterium]|nr:T9SS type A sorting domain-containing protein [Flavobacteriales bacterium]